MPALQTTNSYQIKLFWAQRPAPNGRIMLLPSPVAAAYLGICMKTIIALTVILLATEALSQGPTPLPALSTVDRQVALDRNGFGVGLIDNKDGPKTRAALADFRQARGITNEADLRTSLALDQIPTFTNHIVNQDDLDQLGEAPSDWLAASEAARMACASVPELLSEKYHVSESYLLLLNPGIADWSPTNVLGKNVKVPYLPPRQTRAMAACITLDCRRFRLRALDADGNIMASFPCSIAMAGKKAPGGALKVVVFAPNPNYTFDPLNYPESHRARAIGRKLIIPAGPNNPVGDYWIGLNLPGFGIHGTPHPESIGSRESHGCFRLTNWDVRRLAQMITDDTPVQVSGLESE